MGRLANLRAGFIHGASDLKRRTRERVPVVLERINRPKFLVRQIDGATRAGQVMSLILLGPLIVVSLALIVAFNQVMADVFTGSDPTEQIGITAFLITATTLGAFVLSAYTWFQFVRTAAFGWFL